MRKVKVEEAVGMVLCHDLTKIVPGSFKGRAFKKGHIICEEDIPEMLCLGKEHIYVWECSEGFVHEDEAAERIALAVAGRGLMRSEPAEGKVKLTAAYRGLLKIDVPVVHEINALEQVILSTLHNHSPVEAGEPVGGTRVIPLVVEEEKVNCVEELANKKAVIEVLPFQTMKVGVVTTGSEVYEGRIEDQFGPVVTKKLNNFNCPVIRQIIVPDDPQRIATAIRELVGAGAELLITTGGMSVDPDDVTPAGVKATGAELVTYGAPVLPGAMFMLAYLGDIPVLGLPGCVMYARTTIFDLVLPRVLAGERIKREELTRMGHGGFCRECEDCTYPRCALGKGW